MTGLQATLAPLGVDMFDRGELRTIRIDNPPGSRIGQTTERRYWTGRAWQLGTAAYWENIAADASPPQSYQLGEGLAEELGACLLGGYGVPADVAAAAFARLRDEGVFQNVGRSNAAKLEALLSEPFTEFPKPRRYRFPHQRAGRIDAALTALASARPPTEPLRLRDWLQRIPGVGPKTASWVVRNQTASDDVAIIDIHIIRAGTAAGVFDAGWRVERDYRRFEQAFLLWAAEAGIRTSFLDACVWGVLAHAGTDARDILGTPHLSTLPPPVWPIDA